MENDGKSRSDIYNFLGDTLNVIHRVVFECFFESLFHCINSALLSYIQKHLRLGVTVTGDTDSDVAK